MPDDVDHQSTAAQYRVRDTELCRHLISCGAEVDIFMAAALGDEALVTRVLDADPGCITARIGHPGYAPVPPGHIYQWKLQASSVLLVAAKHGGRKIYDLLLTRSPLKEQFLAACELADGAHAASVLASSPDLLTQLTTDDRGQIVAAAFSHNIPALELMLKLGFDVNTRGGEGFTPIGHAALRGHVDTVRLLIRTRPGSRDPQRLRRHGARRLPMGLAQFPRSQRRLSRLCRGARAGRRQAVLPGLR